MFLFPEGACVSLQLRAQGKEIKVLPGGLSKSLRTCVNYLGHKCLIQVNEAIGRWIKFRRQASA